MLDEIISDQENLYRRVPIHPNNWKENRPTSAIFKCSFGVSVDRAGQRTENEIIENFNKQYTLKAVISITAGFCRQVETVPVYFPFPPDENNIYHAEIRDQNNELELSGKKAKLLAKNAIICWQTADVQ